jgi:hypothetical protein
MYQLFMTNKLRANHPTSTSDRQYNQYVKYKIFHSFLKIKNFRVKNKLFKVKIITSQDKICFKIDI